MRKLFVYGTLRPGMALYPLLADVVVKSIPATIEGELHSFMGGAYPVAFLDKPGVIKGDILTCLEHGGTLNSVCAMERRAGYTEKLVDATTEDGRIIEVMAFDFTEYRFMGTDCAVTSGDWKQFCAENRYY